MARSSAILLTLSTVVFLSAGCICLHKTAKCDFLPESGDLLFLVAGDTDFSSAITDATAQGVSLKFDHAALAERTSDGACYVLEASSEHGVVRTSWKEFLGTAAKVNGRPGVVVKSVKGGYPVAAALARAKSHLGEAYDWSYLPDNGKMYCTELLYECCRSADGTPIFSAKPMNFRDANGELPQFWIDLFRKLGEEVPEGVPGTNPNDMANEPILIERARLF